ncbi:MAG: cold-shock protein [Gammaproteobacteria bacterium]|jgi:CspA family cold shock protein|nr:cold-shock protein [Gammaproteobacteria bacterium]|tara:strand:+ start:436 stop:828 length:393 start_codon:yes stop_codon:yes gene_type:complete
MNSLPKILIISLLISAMAFLLLKYIGTSSLVIPSSITEVLEFVVLLAAIIAASVISSKPSTPSKGETGTVKWFNLKKGYGFITRDQGDDVFVHYRNIQGKSRRAISEGQRVKFIVIDGDKGLQADEVEAI